MVNIICYVLREAVWTFSRNYKYHENIRKYASYTFYFIFYNWNLKHFSDNNSKKTAKNKPFPPIFAFFLTTEPPGYETFYFFIFSIVNFHEFILYVHLQYFVNKNLKKIAKNKNFSWILGYRTPWK